jgi:hypothetical protein
MLPERVRRELLRELVDAATLLLEGLKEKDAAKIAQSMSDARAARSGLSDGYVCDMSRAFDEIESCMRAHKIPKVVA